MSEELTIQGGDSQEDVTIERTIEVSIDKNGLGIESGQVFPSVTVDFAPIIAPASVHWGDITGRPDPVTNVFYNSREADFEYDTFDGEGRVIVSRDRLKEILDVPTNAVNVYPYGVNFDDLKVGDVVLSFGGEAGIVREKDDFGLVLCSYDYARVFSSYYEKHEGEWVQVDATETPIRLEAAEVGNLVSIDENGNISDSGSKASDKADKVSNATSGNFASLDSNGNLADSGHKHSDYLTSHQDISGKADKVSSATNGNFAGLDGNGNLTDSGKAFTDFVAYIGYNPRESDFIYRKGDENGQDEIIISKENLTKLIVPEISIDIATDALSDEKTASPKAVKSYVDTKVSTAYKAAGSAASVAALGSLDASHEGFVYNMSASFTTTSDFVEGSGVTYPAGTNVVIVNVGTSQSTSYKYDVLAGFVDISGKEDKSNKVTSLSSSSTDTQYPSAKAVYDQLANSLPQLYSEDVGNESARIDAAIIRMMCEALLVHDTFYTYRFSSETGLEVVTDDDRLHFQVNNLNLSVQYDDDWELYFDKTIFKVRMFDGSDPYELKFDLNNGLVVGDINVNGKILDFDENKADKVSGATAGDFAGLDAYGNLTDSGYDASDFATASQGTKADNAIPMPSGGSTGQVLKKTSDGVEWANESGGGGGTSTDVQINGTSITSNDVANIITEGSYNASTNKIATMSDLPSVSGKADKVSGATNGNLAALDSNGNLTDSGYDASDFPAKIVVAYVDNLSSEQVGSLSVGDIVVKGLGNNKRLYTVALKENDDGGMCCLVGFYDYKMELVYYIYNDGWDFYTNTEYNIGNCVQKSNTAGLLKNDGTVDTTQYGTYSKPAGGIPASDLASGVIPSVPVTDVTVGGTSVVSSGTAAIPAIPDITNCIQKSQTAGLVKNDGTIDTTSYGTYSKPSGGIPSSDMTNAVQTSLGKADTAYQLPSGGIPASDLASGVIPTVPTISTDIATDKTSTTKTAAPSAVWNEVHPAVGSSQPAGGMLPNVMYNIGTLSGNTTFAMASASDNTIVNHWYWTFDTPSTAPTITWPQAITSWNGGSAPTINASKHYEISVLNGIGTYMEI